MTFDKTRAMRNAERFLSQGKISSAIAEYEQVVKHDARDFGTINMLGDLLTKNKDHKAAIECYTTVADHYGSQGFAQKAIAVYNKIAKLEPSSIDVSRKLADLYKQKGSISEARAHYSKVAEHYEKLGKKIDALAMWKEIALLAPNDTAAYLNLADAYFDEGQSDEALDAYLEAGNRLVKAGDHEGAVAAFNKGLRIRSDDLRLLSAFASSEIVLGRAFEAAERLESAVEEYPHSREIRVLLIDCLIEARETAKAEKALIRLVEMEPANYLMFLKLAEVFLDTDDLDSASRTLSMSSEHMLMGGQAEEFRVLVSRILEKAPEHLDALRLMSRYCTWQKDEAALTDSLTRLAAVARSEDSVEDERYALLQLTMLVPYETSFADRLREINDLHGYEDHNGGANLFDERFLKNQVMQGGPVSVGFDNEVATVEASAVVGAENGFEIAGAVLESSSGGVVDSGFSFNGPVHEVEDNGDLSDAVSFAVEPDDLSDVEKEAESIRFYIENGYDDLARTALAEMRVRFGDADEVTQLESELGIAADDLAVTFEPAAETVSTETVETVETKAPEISPISIGLDDLRTELGLEDSEPVDDSDYETHFNTATAYKEMGLIEEAIKEFQEAVTFADQNDGTRRFFSCANLLGHCFMEQGMPSLAIKWFERTLATPGLTAEEKQGLWYELAAAFEADGDTDNASKYFEMVYAENVDFRDVSERIKCLLVSQ